jgi:hypothetical protein
MSVLLKRFVFICLACWLLLGQTGMAWKTATCIFTGSVSYGWGNQVSCCAKSKPVTRDVVSRASCCTYDQFQVKLSAEQQLKFVDFDFVATVPSGSMSTMFGAFAHSEPSLFLEESDFSPPASVKRAFIQVFLI